MTNKYFQNLIQEIQHNITNPDKLKSYIQILDDLEKIITQKLRLEKFNLSPLNIERLSKALYNIQLAKSIIVENLNKITTQYQPTINELPQHIKILTFIDNYLQETEKISILDLLQEPLKQYGINLKSFIEKQIKNKFDHNKLIEINQNEII